MKGNLKNYAPKISHLEECEKQAQFKIAELENEQWLKEREIIALRAKVESLSENLEKMKAENKILKEEKSATLYRERAKKKSSINLHLI